MCISECQSEGARTAYFIPGRVGEGGPAATESTPFVCVFVCICVCPLRWVAGGAGRDPPAKETLRFCPLGWVAGGPAATHPQRKP